MSKTGARIVERTEMRSITSPGFAMQGDKAKYDAMKVALLAAVSVGVPELTVAPIKARAQPLPPEATYPGGAKAGCGLAGPQPDRAAHGVISREAGTPVRNKGQ